MSYKFTPAYLTGGTNATTNTATWGTVTDGEFAITIDGTVHEILGIDFSNPIINTSFTYNVSFVVVGVNLFAQTFSVSAGTTSLTSVKVRCSLNGGYTGDVEFHIYSTSGGLPLTSLGSKTILGNTFSNDTFKTITFDSSIPVSSGIYALVIKEPTAIFGEEIEFSCDSGQPYAGGQVYRFGDHGAFWAIPSFPYDLNLEVYGDTSMEYIASKIQTQIRGFTSSTETCTWTGTRFLISSANTTNTSAITVTSAISIPSGTDISGAGATNFMDCDTGNGTVTSAATTDNTAGHDDNYVKVCYGVDSTDTTNALPILIGNVSGGILAEF